MREMMLAAVVLPMTLIAEGQMSNGADQAPQAPIPYSNLQHLLSTDSSATIVEKAAKVLPRENQAEWMRIERTFFIHFGPNTFREVEWGTGREDPQIFNPKQLDADQWMRAVKDGGGKMVVLVCKHHDGLSLWPTRYSGHSVAASPWRGGKGNLVREVADAARKYGIELGVYLSPADLYQLRTNPTNPDGYYGDGSTKLASTIPTDPASFKADPSKARQTAPGSPHFSYNVDDYNRYFLNQLYELLTEYGPIREVWFDGANPDPSVHEEYDYNAWYSMIRKLQPKAIIFGKGPDGRWVGNESGVGRTTEWSVIPLSSPPDEFRWPDMRDQDLGGRDKLTPGSYLWWYPAETNVPILHGWFWAPQKPSRTAAELIDIYYQSVGRNSNWILNISPDNRGLIPDLQVAHLKLMNEVIDETFAKNFAKGGEITADSSNSIHPPSKTLDGNLDTWWEAAAGKASATLTLTLPKPATFDVVSLQEAVDHRSQRVESFSVDTWDGVRWNQMDEQTTIGHKRLLRWNTPVTSDRIRVRITGSRLEPTLAEIGLFKQASYVGAPVISDRSAEGVVGITSTRDLPVVYTVDGTIPTAKSPVYHSPIPLPMGGTVQAAVLTPRDAKGMVASRRFAGMAPTGWRIVGPDPSAQNAIDGNPETFWHSSRDAKSPPQITVDMGSTRDISGFAYLPRSGSRTGLISKYRFETSTEGQNWKVEINNGRFDNIQNNPELQEVKFAPVDARYFRLTVLEDVGNTGMVSVAELSVLPETATQ
jgi:alpha-L-fucosidase